jgi:hypothetical protein
VAEVEVGFGAIHGDKHLTVLVRRHGAGIDVEVGVELLDGDGDAAGFEDSAEAGGGDSLANRTNHATGNKDELRHGPRYSNACSKDATGI